MRLIRHSWVHGLSQHVRTRWWGIVLVGAFLALGAQETVAEAASYTPRPGSRLLWVGFQNGLLSLEAKDVPARKVLNEVCAKTGVFLQASVPLQGSVTVSFKDLPVETAFRRLFGPDVNFIFLYHGQKPAPGSVAIPSDVWVLAKGTREVPQTATTPHDDQEAVAPSAAGDSQNSMQEIERAFDRNPLAVRNAAMGSRSQEVRLKAIAYLGQQPTRDAVDVLLKVAALDSEAGPLVRQGALDALAGLAHSSPQVQEILAQHVKTKGDPEMRQLAADILGIHVEPIGNEAASDEALKDGERRGRR
jgi:hypothetical protein